MRVPWLVAMVKPKAVSSIHEKRAVKICAHEYFYYSVDGVSLLRAVL